MPASEPILLCLDTATDRLHAALVVGQSVAVLDEPGGAQASTRLLPALDGLVRQAGLVWSQLDAIAFGSGPGAFTGLRTACSVAQGLALGLDRPVIALDTLMAVAEDARLHDAAAWSAGDALWVLQDARMDELYVCECEWDGQDWQVRQPAQLWSLVEPASRWSAARPTEPSQHGATDRHRLGRWAGNAVQAYPTQLGFLMPGQCPGLRGEPAAPRGMALAALARRAWVRGDLLDAALALPRYVRDKVALTTAERQAARDQA